MTSTMSRGPSPHASSPYDPRSDSEESWQYIDYTSMGAGSGPDSIGFLPSPASGSLNGYAIVGRGQAVVNAPESPVFLDLSDGSPYSLGSAAGFPSGIGAGFAAQAVALGSPSIQSAPLFMGSAGVGAAPAGVAPNDLLFANAPMNGESTFPVP